MKNRLFKILILMMLSFGAYNVINIYNTRNAQAFCNFDFGAVVIAEIQSALDTMMSQMEAAMDFLSQYGEITNEQNEETEEQLREFAQGNISRDIETVRAQAEIEEAGNGVRRTMDYQEQVAEDVVENFPAPSRHVCEKTTISKERDNARKSSEHLEKVDTENDRRRNFKASGTLGSSGPAAQNRKLSEALEETCIQDEQRGNVSSICPESVADQDEYPEPQEFLTCDGCTIDPDKRDEYDLHRALQNPAPEVQILSKDTADDPGRQKAYIDGVKEIAFAELVSNANRRVSASKEPMLGNCDSAKALVEDISQKYYGTPNMMNPPGVCPSEMAIRKAEMMRLKDPETMTDYTMDAMGNRVKTELYVQRLTLISKFETKAALEGYILSKAVRSLKTRQPITPPVE